MKSLFPPSFIGYPWSKIVVEQGLLFAQSAGMPLAIFRFPQTCLAAESGFTTSEDIKVRIAMSVFSTGMIPHNFVNNWTEPVDTISKFSTAIFMNPKRRYTIYHCINPDPKNYDIEFSDAGINLKKVSYETFKQACLQEGSSSSLDGHWSLIDYFAPYWFSEKPKRGLLPLSDTAIREDCPDKIEWPGFITSTVNSNTWIYKNKETWPLAIPEGSIDIDILEERSRLYAERMEVGYEDVYSSSTLEGLEQLVKNINTPAAGIPGKNKSTISINLNRKLYNIAALARERNNHPEILQEIIERPIFILGINRTGTTFLHRLLSRDDQFWTLKPYEIMRPVINDGNYKYLAGTNNDPRMIYTKDLISAYNMVEGFAGIHHVDIEEPEEEFELLESSFAAWSLASLYNIPDYKTWLIKNGSADAYRAHKQIMKHYSWQRKQADSKQQQWLLKMPYHLKELSQLLKTYPDAIIIQTHRNPVEFMGSWNHLVEQVQSLMAVPQDKHFIGAEQLEFMGTMLNQAMEFRAAHPLLESRWIDISYYDLVKNPMIMVDQIYNNLQIKLPEQARINMLLWLHKQDESRKNETRHTYTLEEYGLTDDKVKKTFKPYIDFIKSRGINMAKEMLTV